MARNVKLRFKSSDTLLAILLAGPFLLAGGCSKESFVPAQYVTDSPSPGFYVHAAKVDIVLAQDDTPSMKQAIPTVEQEIPAFLKNLENSGWNYRLVTVPLSRDRAVREILASKYDGNWADVEDGKSWTPPFPGAKPSDERIPKDYFVAPDKYSEFIDESAINWGVGQYENGFESIREGIDERIPESGFFRKDALLALVVLGNGEDGSGVNFCTVAGFSGPVPCEYDPYCGSPYSDRSKNQWHEQCEAKPSWDSSFAEYRDYFNDLKKSGITSKMKFYAAVAFHKSSDTQCIQSNSTVGSRYMDMAEEFGGSTFDICTQPIATVLDHLTTDLQNEKIAMRTRYLVIGQEPELSTIEITRYAGGNPQNAKVIPQDGTNGWTYIGGPQTVMTIDSPTEMNEATGYVIELHGDAKLSGSDKATVNFKPKGTVPASG